MPELWRRTGRWLLLGLAVATLWTLFALLRLPSPALFGALAAGLALALLTAAPPQLPGRAFTAAQAVLGVAIGAMFDLGTLRSLEHDWFPVLAVTLATLALSVGAGFVLRLHPKVSAATGVFAMIAGGASGVVAIARELGADDRIVAVVQYLRVLLIVVGMPLVARLAFGHPGGGAPAAGPAADLAYDLAFTAGCLAVGLLAARWLPIPAASLLAPLLVAVLGSLLLPGSPGVPAWLQDLGFVLIGLQVGLRFTRQAVRDVAALLPLATATILGLVAASAGLGLLLSAATGRSALDGYLATTPGGLYVVLATAVTGGGDVTFVLTVQLVRLFVMLFSAPLLAAWLRRGPTPQEATG